MAFDSLTAFFAMEGHGFYVWLAYGMFSLLILGMLVNAVQHDNAVRRRIQRQRERESDTTRAPLQDAEIDLP